MVRSPVVWVRASAASEFTVTGLNLDRVVAVAERFSKSVSLRDLPSCHLHVRRASQPHSGLGSGTQQDLAVATAMVQLFGLRDSLGREHIVSQIAARGRRSAVGTHGFFRGGFIAETGIEPELRVGKLETRVDFPEQWPIVLISPTRPIKQVFIKILVHSNGRHGRLQRR